MPSLPIKLRFPRLITSGERWPWQRRKLLITNGSDYLLELLFDRGAGSQQSLSERIALQPNWWSFRLFNNYLLFIRKWRPAR